MKYRILEKTGLKVSVIGMGTWQFGGEWGKDFSQEEVNAMFDRARELGMNLIDTAECYGDHLSEKLIGAAIERDRGRWIVATKFGHKFHGYQNRSDRRTPKDVSETVEESLRALRSDYIDILQYHSLREEEVADDALQQAVIRLKEQGKIRHIGNSIPMKAGTSGHVELSEKAQVELVQVIYNRLDRRPETRDFPYCTAHQLGVLARVPLASGFLTGKYKPGQRFSGEYRQTLKPDEIDAKLREAEKVQREEVPGGVPMAQWALAWCLQHPAVTCVIPGCKSVQQVESNARAADLHDLVRDDHPQAAH
jgi:aryl-alcohol dehydrogenase-like predicted oxidoreductase